jgi:hypothetical protein
MAAKVTGVFSINDTKEEKEHEFRFTAIAFGRIGGQNIGVKISKETQKRLKGMGHEPEEVIIQMQRDLLQGNLTIPDNITRESFADSE